MAHSHEDRPLSGGGFRWYDQPGNQQHRRHIANISPWSPREQTRDIYANRTISSRSPRPPLTTTQAAVNHQDEGPLLQTLRTHPHLIDIHANFAAKHGLLQLLELALGGTSTAHAAIALALLVSSSRRKTVAFGTTHRVQARPFYDGAHSPGYTGQTLCHSSPRQATARSSWQEQQKVHLAGQLTYTSTSRPPAKQAAGCSRHGYTRASLTQPRPSSHIPFRALPPQSKIYSSLVGGRRVHLATAHPAAGYAYERKGTAEQAGEVWEQDGSEQGAWSEQEQQAWLLQQAYSGSGAVALWGKRSMGAGGGGGTQYSTGGSTYQQQMSSSTAPHRSRALHRQQQQQQQQQQEEVQELAWQQGGAIGAGGDAEQQQDGYYDDGTADGAEQQSKDKWQERVGWGEGQQWVAQQQQQQQQEVCAGEDDGLAELAAALKGLMATQGGYGA